MHNKGFTSVELMISAFLLTVLGLGILGLQYVMGKSQVATISNHLEVEQSNYAIATMVREVRTARPADNGTYLIEKADDDEFIFYSDSNVDNKTERIRYSLNVNTLTKYTTDPTGSTHEYLLQNEKPRVVTEIVQNEGEPLFIYYNGNGQPLPTPADRTEVKMVRVYLRLNDRPQDPDNDYILESFATVRMVKTNL